MQYGIKYGALPIVLAFDIAMWSIDSSAKRADQYDCKTYRFSSTEDDKDFSAKNERKLFTIHDIGETLVVKMTSPDFEAKTDEYKVLLRDDFGFQAYIPSPYSFAFQTLNFSFNPAGVHGERFEASVSMLGTFFSNTWLLSCSKVK